MDKYTIGDFKNDLGRDSKKLFLFIYKVYFPKIKKYIKNNSGDDPDAKDVFQEGILATIKNVEDDKVKESTLFESYLYSVCKFIWLNHLRVPKFDTLKDQDLSDEYGLEDESVSGIEDSMERNIFQKNFKLLDKVCQDLLRYFFDKVPLREIAKIMKFNDENYAKKRKHICKERLVKMIKEDPDYKIFLRDKNI